MPRPVWSYARFFTLPILPYYSSVPLPLTLCPFPPPVSFPPILSLFFPPALLFFCSSHYSLFPRFVSLAPFLLPFPLIPRVFFVFSAPRAPPLPPPGWDSRVFHYRKFPLDFDLLHGESAHREDRGYAVSSSLRRRCTVQRHGPLASCPGREDEVAPEDEQQMVEVLTVA